MHSRLRPYQQAAVDKLRTLLAAGRKRLMLCAPVGAGKTVIAVEMVEKAVAKGNRVTFVAPAVTLIDQTVAVLEREGIKDIGVMQADHPMTRAEAVVQVASPQTLARRKLPESRLVIVDEAHEVFKVIKGWMDDSPETVFIGLSATPASRGLGRMYEDIVTVATTQELMDGGFLSPHKVFAPAHIDVSQIPLISGDYAQDELSRLMRGTAIVADIVATWLRLGQGRPTFCFAVDRAHAQRIVDDFRAAGIACEYIDAFTDALERRRIQREFAVGGAKVVVSVGCLSRGIDWDVRCIILARPTKSVIVHVQQIGRGLRTAAGKTDCVILDHADNHKRHGFVSDIVFTELNDGPLRRNATSAADDGPPIPRECPKCTFLMPASKIICTNCGEKLRVKSDRIEIDGELVEAAPGKPRERKGPKVYTAIEQQAWLSGFIQIGLDRKYRPGWSGAMFKDKFGDWPSKHLLRIPAEPLPETRSWVRARQIRYAKGKGKQRVSA